MFKEEHYPSLDTCKALKKAGFPPTQCVMVFDPVANRYNVMDCERLDILVKLGFKKSIGDDFYPCPSLYELTEKLPTRISSVYCLRFDVVERIAYVYSYDDANTLEENADFFFEGDTLPELASEVWLYCKEQEALLP